MKTASLILTLLAAAGITPAARISFSVDPAAHWLGYINLYDQAGNLQSGFVETNFATASAHFLPGPSLPLTLAPNTRLWDENVLDPFWVDQATFEATMVCEFNFYQEVPGAVGDIVTFNWVSFLPALPPGYEVAGFIKVLDGYATWTTYQFVEKAMPASDPRDIGTLSLVVSDSGLSPGGTALVQAGFYFKGPYVSSGSPTLTHVDIFAGPTEHCPTADLNDDCKVDFADLAELASQWLTCGLTNQTQCWL